MSGWQSYAPMSSGAKETSTDQGGAEFYTIVVGASCINPCNFIPQAPKLDTSGLPQKSKYPNANQPYWLVDLDPAGDTEKDNVDNRMVSQWKTPAAQLGSLGNTEKTAVNSLKKFLNGFNTALWFHNGNTDFCSRFGGPHLHVILESVKKPDGQFQNLHNLSAYQNAKKAVKNTNGYMSSQSVSHCEKLIAYLGQPPRVFMGTRSKILGILRAKLTGQDPPTDCPWSEDDFDNDDGNPQSTWSSLDTSSNVGRKRHNDFDDCADTAIGSNNKRGSGYNEFISGSNKENEPPNREMDVLPAAGHTGPVGSSYIKELRLTPGDRIAQVLENIMRHLNAFEYEIILQKVSKLEPTDPVYLTWSRLVKRPGTNAAIERIHDYIKMEYMNMSFHEMCNRYLNSGEWRDAQYYDVGTSLQALNAWTKYNGISFDTFIRTVVKIMDRQQPKMNTLLILGPSNSGKSIMLKRTLEPIVPFNCQIGAVGSASQFLWQRVAGSRAVFIEECRLDPSHIETAKLVFGGEPATVDIKCKPQQRAMRSPVFITSNHLPWVLAQSSADRTALENRTFVFNVRSDSDLRLLTKYINPVMWLPIITAVENSSTESVLSVEDCFKYLDVVLQHGETKLAPMIDLGAE